MRFSTVAITLFGAAASASAYTLFARQSYPACAITCTENANLEGCAATDNHCLCTNPAFVANTTACVEASCTGSDLTNALAFSQEICEKVGVTLTASSTAASSATAPASSPTSGTVSGSAATTVTGSSSAAPAATSTTTSGASSLRQASGALALVAAGLIVLAL